MDSNESIRLAGDPPARALSSGAALVAASQATVVVAGGLTTIIVARLLGPSATGSFNVAMSAVMLLGVLSSLGIEVAISYMLGRQEWRPAAALRQTQVWAFALGTAGLVVGIGLGMVGSDTIFRGIELHVLVIAFAAVPFGLSVQYGAYVALAMSRYEAHAVILGAQTVLLLALVAVLVPLFDLTGAAIAIFLSRFVSSGAALAWGLRALPLNGTGWRKGSVRSLREAVRFGIQTNAATILQQLNYRADVFLLNAVVGGAIVGHYTVALAITMPGLLLARAFGAAVLPRISSLSRGTPERLERTVRMAVRHSILLGGLAIATMAIGLLLVPFVYGSSFADAIPLGFILVPGTALFAVGAVLGTIVVGMGRPRYALYNGLLVTPMTLGLYAWLVPTLEGYGAAIASTISYAATGLVWCYFFRKVTEIRFSRELLPGLAELQEYALLLRRVRARLRGSGSSATSVP